MRMCCNQFEIDDGKMINGGLKILSVYGRSLAPLGMTTLRQNKLEPKIFARS